MDEKTQELLASLSFDAGTADVPLLTCLVLALVEEGVLPPQAVTKMFARARAIIRELPTRDLAAENLEFVGSRLRSKLAERGHENVPPKAPPEWWKQD